MTLMHAIVLGAVQGVTEFLPISSSGFLILIPELFGWQVQSLAFDAFLHIATLAAVVAALWGEVKAMAMAILFRKKDDASASWRRLAAWIVLSTIPVLAAGYVLQEVLLVEFRSVQIVAWSFIVWGVVLYVVDRRAGSHMTTRKDRSAPPCRLAVVGWRRALFIGLSQAIALIPGTSRSGITITAGLAAGLSRETAARFSFLLAIPAIAAAGFWKLGSVASGSETIELFPLAVGFTVALVTAFLTVRFLLTFLRRHTFAELAVFRVVVGVAMLLISL